VKIEIEPIGRVHGGRENVVDDDWGAQESWIVLEPNMGADALEGIESFSHVEVLFFFDFIGNPLGVFNDVTVHVEEVECAVWADGHADGSEGAVG
jgi:tRNA (Thr-GGU) A37 N-methylase